MGETSRSPNRKFLIRRIEETLAARAEQPAARRAATTAATSSGRCREAEKGRIPVGPRKSRERNGEPGDVKILPLRPEAEVIRDNYFCRSCCLMPKHYSEVRGPTGCVGLLGQEARWSRTLRSAC